MPTTVEINGTSQVIDADEEMPLLWVLRDLLNLTGTKYGCGEAQCGACTVHLDGSAIRSCVTPLSRCAGRSVTTIEGVHNHPLQQAWKDLNVAQCGFCQPGQIMGAAALLKKVPHPTDSEISSSMAGHICRCGTYVRIRAAIKKAAYENRTPNWGQAPIIRRKIGHPPMISRREFLERLSLGLVIGACPQLGVAKSDRALVANEFIRIALDGQVTIMIARAEMGQGVRSSLPLLMADEMGADVQHVQVLQAEADKKYGDQNTDGSSSVRKGYKKLRTLAAQARVMLTQAAAKKWGVPEGEIEVREHHAWHEGKKLTFAELVPIAAELDVPKAPKLRPESELPHLGKPFPMLDGEAIVTGKAQFGADVRVPGMLFAVVLHPPTVFGRVKTFDDKETLKIPGVKAVVELPHMTGSKGFQPLGGIAVVADNTWAAMKGKAALKVEWELGANADYDSATFKEMLIAKARQPGKVSRNKGDVDKALSAAAKTISAEYYVPHLAHAAMEPPAALAHATTGRCVVWTCTQNPQAARKEVANILGLAEARVTVYTTLLGGGFGRKSKPDYVAEAAFISRHVGAPVRLQWTREDDLAHSFYNAVNAQRLDAGLDDKGGVTAWRHRTVFTPIATTFNDLLTTPLIDDLGQGITDLPLDIPNVRAERAGAEAKIRIGWMRSVYNIFHGFAIGSFIDEIAHARGMDPISCWKEIIGPARMVTLEETGSEKISNYGQPLSEIPIDTGRYMKVIDHVANASGWGSRKHLGFAAHRSFLASVACVVSMPEPLKVDEVWIAIDAGTVLNTDRVVNQMEGAVIFGMSIALHQAITVKGGVVEQRNLRDYRLTRMHEAPAKIHVHIMQNNEAPGGVGEPGVPPVAPAMANALFALTGKRVRELPLRV